MRSWRNILLLGLCLIATSSLARDYQMFRREWLSKGSWGSLPAADYNALVPKITYGDRVIFSDGTSYQVDSIQGSGNTTLILGTNGNPPAALRIPIRMGWFELGTADIYEALNNKNNPPRVYVKKNDTEYIHTRAILDSMIAGYGELESAGVNTLKIYKSRRGEYILIERLPQNSISFHAYMTSHNNNQFFKMTDALLQFVEPTAQFSKIGDFRSDQLKYNPETGKWVLIDWTDFHEKASLNSSGFAIDGIVQELKNSDIPALSAVAEAVKNKVVQTRVRLELHSPAGCIVRLRELLKKQ